MNTNGDRPPAGFASSPNWPYCDGLLPNSPFKHTRTNNNNNCHELNHNTHDHGENNTKQLTYNCHWCHKRKMLPNDPNLALVCLECLGNYTEEEMNEALGILAVIMVFFLAVCSCQVNFCLWSLFPSRSCQPAPRCHVVIFLYSNALLCLQMYQRAKWELMGNRGKRPMPMAPYDRDVMIV